MQVELAAGRAAPELGGERVVVGVVVVADHPWRRPFSAIRLLQIRALAARVM